MTLPVHADLLPAIDKIIEDACGRISTLAGFEVQLRPVFSYNIKCEKDLQILVCDEFDITWKKVLSPSKKREIVAARQSYCYLYKILFPKKSLASIGESIGRDHTSVIHAIKTIKNRLETNDELIAPKISKIIELVKP